MARKVLILKTKNSVYRWEYDSIMKLGAIFKDDKKIFSLGKIYPAVPAGGEWAADFSPTARLKKGKRAYIINLDPLGDHKHIITSPIEKIEEEFK